MKQSHYQWKFSKTIDKKQQDYIENVLIKLGVTTSLAPFLYNRKLTTEESIVRFLKPNLADLYDPYLLNDMEKAIQRIHEAVEKNQSILIYGDYDADGITSTSVLKESLDLLGADVHYYIPNRFSDGYGPNKQVYAEKIEQDGIELIITVDNGVSGHDAIDYANEQGVDVIITDHHNLPSQLPNAYAIVHPRHPNASYPFGELAGVGVAFKVACALLGEVPVELLDLVAIGTVADQVSLLDENRILVKAGLQQLKQTDRIGLLTLAKVAGISLSNVDEKAIGFGIAPRLNAIGRLGDATMAVELLTTFDDVLAARLSKQVQELNEKRQTIVQEIMEMALQQVDQHPASYINVLAGESWHEGVLGIVASRIVEQTGKPTIVLGIDPVTKLAKGSARSVDNLDLYDALSTLTEHLVKFGGHQMAAGMTLNSAEIDALRDGLNQYIDVNQIDVYESKVLNIDQALAVDDISLSIIESIKILAPFGTDNPTPIFAFKDVSINKQRQIGTDKNHLKLQLNSIHGEVDCIAFGKGTQLNEFSSGGQVSLAGELEINEWNGLKKPQLHLIDYQVSGLQLFDKRSNQFPTEIPEKTAYIMFQPYSRRLLKSIEEKWIFDYSENNQWSQAEIDSVDAILIVDVPLECQEINEVIQKFSASRVYLWCYSKEQCYLTGLPSRKEFANLFAFLKKYPKVDIQYRKKQVAAFLKIKETMLSFMIQVFFELKFVTIENGVVNLVQNPKNQLLTESTSYQHWEKQMNVEEFLLFNDINQIYNWIEY